MAIFRGSGSSLTGSAIDPTEALLDSDFTVNGILVRTASGVYSTTPDNTANWDTAYSWGDWSVGVDKSFVDGLNVDADTLDSQEGTWYQDRTNHTGTQTLSTISDSGTAAEADIVGTVSESGGTPTGAIIEQGSNSNGEYTKFADGTMICSKLGLSVSFGNSDYLSGTWTYPASFVSAPTPMFNTTPATGDGASVFRKAGTIGSAGEGASITSIRVSAIVGNDWVSGDELTALRGYAIGRWF